MSFKEQQGNGFGAGPLSPLGSTGGYHPVHAPTVNGFMTAAPDNGGFGMEMPASQFARPTLGVGTMPEHMQPAMMGNRFPPSRSYAAPTMDGRTLTRAQMSLQEWMGRAGRELLSMSDALFDDEMLQEVLVAFRGSVQPHDPQSFVAAVATILAKRGSGRVSSHEFEVAVEFWMSPQSGDPLGFPYGSMPPQGMPPPQGSGNYLYRGPERVGGTYEHSGRPSGGLPMQGLGYDAGGGNMYCPPNGYSPFSAVPSGEDSFKGRMDWRGNTQ